MAYKGFAGNGYVGNFLSTAALELQYPAQLYAGRRATVEATAGQVAPYFSNGVVWAAGVSATTDPLTGMVSLSTGSTVLRELIADRKILTAGAGYTGTGAALSFNLGFRPTFVIIKQNGTQPAVIKTDSNWQRQTDTLSNSASIPAGITLTDVGFDLSTDTTVNANSAAYNYFASGNLSGESFLSHTWQGNATQGHIIDALAGKNVAAVIIKRDNTQQPVLSIKSSPTSWIEDGTAGSYLVVNADGTLVTDTSLNTNEWAGVSGEGINALAFIDAPENISVTQYTGNFITRKIPVPWEPGLVLIWPNGNTGSKIQMWMQGIPQGTCALSNGAAHQTGRITTVDGGAVTLAAHTATNTNGVQYTMVCVRKSKEVVSAGVYRRPAVRRKSIQLSTGYIDCGVGSASLNITGAYSLEFYGAFWPGSETGMVGGAGVNDETGKQHPLIWRSNGADNPTPTDTTAWGMELCAPQFNTLSWTGCTLIAPTMASMQLIQTGSTNLDYFPMNSGYVIDGGRVVHLVVCHYGDGNWKMFADGVLIKERKRKLLTAVGGPLKADGATVISGAKTIIGARLRGTGTPEFAHNLQFKLARLYSRGLTPAEVQTRYQKTVFGDALTDVADFVEEWDANNAYGTTLPATINSANNGTIVNGVIF